MVDTVPVDPNIHQALGLILFSAIILMLVSAILFVVIVTYLGQWDIYYPRLYRWLEARKAAKLEKARKDKKRMQKLKKKGE